MIRNFPASTALALGLLALPALAGHPLATDDVGTQGHGGLELEASALAVPLTRVGPREVGIGLSLHGGLGPHVDLGVSALYVGSRGSTGWRTRMGDPTFDLKWRFLDGGAGAALALRLDYRAPQAADAGWSGHDVGAVLVGSCAEGPVELHANAGARRAAVGTPDEAWAVTSALAVGWTARTDLRFLVEWFGELIPGTAGWTGAQGAVQWQAMPNTVLSAGAGPTFLDGAAEWRLTVGLTLTNG